MQIWQRRTVRASRVHRTLATIASYRALAAVRAGEGCRRGRECRNSAVVYWRIAVSTKEPGLLTVRRGPTLLGYWRRRVTWLQHQGALAVARNFEAGIYLLDLLVAAVVAILLTRLVLGVTGSPAWVEGGCTSLKCSGAGC
jgi:hypothetical protein